MLPLWQVPDVTAPQRQPGTHACGVQAMRLWPAGCITPAMHRRPRSTPRSTDPAHGAGGRLNLLLSYGGWRDDSWADRLPRYLEPFGVRAWRADSGVEAQRLIDRIEVHLAVIDLALPLERAQDGSPLSERPAGARLLELMTRLPGRPPMLVVKRRLGEREGSRDVASALDCGAFAVIERPVDMEAMLDAMRRVLARHYADRWPQCTEDQRPT
ncbi:MAG: hypothetical protein Tsb0013_23160 [Phycisphaerales bacterium]